MTLRLWRARPQPAGPVGADEVSRLRLELAAAQIRIAALEAANQQWADMHRSSVETWKAELVQARAALIDVHTALVYDQMAPEDRPLARMVQQ